jgi:hypothetical protein
MDAKQPQSKGDRETPQERDDPKPEELEIDAANDAMGGPTAASHSAGLSSSLRPKQEDAGGDEAGAAQKKQ